MAAQVAALRARAARRRPRGGPARLGRRLRALPAHRRGLRRARGPRRRDRRRPPSGSSAGCGRGESLARAAARPPRGSQRHVRRLRRTVPKIEITPLDYAIRAHEILEDAQRDMLSGVAAPYSGAGVRATAASLEATDAVIGTLRPLLASAARSPRSRPACSACAASWPRSGAPTAASWPPLDALSRSERQRLNGRLGAGLEILAQRAARARDASTRPRSRSCGREAQPPPLPDALGARARRRRRRRGRRRRGRGGAAERRRATRSSERIPFDGPHQAGVLTEPRDAVVLAALDAIAPDRDAARRSACRRSAPGRAS